MQNAEQKLLDIALYEYGYAVVNDAKVPTIYKIIDSTGKKVCTEVFSSCTKAELKLIRIVEEMVAAKSKNKKDKS